VLPHTLVDVTRESCDLALLGGKGRTHGTMELLRGLENGVPCAERLHAPPARCATPEESLCPRCLLGGQCYEAVELVALVHDGLNPEWGEHWALEVCLDALVGVGALEHGMDPGVAPEQESRARHLLVHILHHAPVLIKDPQWNVVQLRERFLNEGLEREHGPGARGRICIRPRPKRSGVCGRNSQTPSRVISAATL
jgi:hypothetical protein